MKRLTEYTIPETGFSVVSEEKYKRILMEEKPSVEKVYNRLKKIEDILGDEYDLNRLRVIMDAEQHGGLIVGYGPGDPGEPGELGVMEEVAADYVVVVRCRDCKWFNHYTMECESDDVATDHEGGASFSINFGPDDFCSYGQRKIETVLTKSDAKDESLEDDHEASK